MILIPATRALLTSLTLLSTAHAICYYPDGTTTLSDVPCNSGSEASFCCGYGFACLSNKICMATSLTIHRNDTQTYVRGSCTDESWRSGNCPNFCVQGDDPWYDNMSGGEGMIICPGSTSDFYCYDYNVGEVSCKDQNNLAVIGTGSAEPFS